MREEREMGVCPVCEGSLRIPYKGEVRYATVIAGYDKATHTLECDNCGGQKMFSRPTGLVPLRNDGTPCKHNYVGRNAGRCYTEYDCTECGDRYGIDSGD